MGLFRLIAVVAASTFFVLSFGCGPRQEQAPPPAAPATQLPAAAPVPAQPTAGQAEQLPPPTVPEQGAFQTGRYRNLFVERGYSSAEADQKLDRAYQQLFHGDPEQEAVFFAAGKNERGSLAYVMDIANQDVRSEGMSYGMMIAVQLDQKADFDALWNWAKTYMYHSNKRHPAYGYFAWQMKPEGKAMDEMPAPDGEEYFTMALLFAAHRWGNGQGIFDYRQQALELLDRMKNRKPITGTVNRTRRTTGGALFNVEQKQVRFTPDHDNFGKNGDHTDPSYHLPAFYELWARWGPEPDRGFWAEAAQVSRDYFVKVTDPETALAPDYAGFDGSPKAASWDAGTALFRFDAWRTAMNWAVDYAWWAKDPRQKELSDRLQRFFESQGVESYGNNFALDGRPTSEDHSTGLIATNAVASLAATDARAYKFVDALWNASVPSGKYRYYDGMLYLLGLLHVSGNFRIYKPAEAGAG
jgi:oligosaccharide reducing-end xylanase